MNHAVDLHISMDRNARPVRRTGDANRCANTSHFATAANRSMPTDRPRELNIRYCLL